MFLRMTLTKRKIEAMLRRNNINDQVMTRWSREQNRNCKFLPGDRVIVKSKRNHWETVDGRKLNGAEGYIVAASTVDGNRMNSEHYKKTHYYVTNGESVHRFLSNSLKAA